MAIVRILIGSVAFAIASALAIGLFVHAEPELGVAMVLVAFLVAAYLLEGK